MKKQIASISTLFPLVFVVALTGCQESPVKRDKPAPPLSERFIPDGHIHAKGNVDSTVPGSAAIPQIVSSQVPALPPIGHSAVRTDVYSISAVNVPVAELLFKLAQDADKEMDIYEGIQGNVTINAINQPLHKILDRISEQIGFMYDLDARVISIRPDFPEWRNYKVDYVNIIKSSKESIEMQMTVSSGAGGNTAGTPPSLSKVTSESKHNFWDSLEKNIQLLAQLDPNANKVILPPGQGEQKGTSPALSSVSQNTVVNPEAGVISVYTTKKQHKAIKQYINQVTKRTDRQVLIEATVVEVLLSDKYEAGIDWSKLQDLSFTSGGQFSGTSYTAALTGNENILDKIKFLKTFGDSKVLSSPKIMAINNQTALLKVVNNLVYFSVDVNVTAATSTTSATTTYSTEIHTVPVGFTMSVTPFVSEDGDITLNVRPTISRKIGEVNDPNPDLANAGVESPIPVIQEKEMSSVLRLKDRQTAIIGGLIEDNNSNDRVGVPWLGDVPVVGDLFAARDDNTQKSELVIFIRPVIVKNPDVDNGDLSSVSRFLKTKNY